MPKNNDDKYKALLDDEAFSECEACGGQLEFEKVNLEDYEGGKLYLMESVPAYVCQECGEIWVPEPIMDEFEKMIATVKGTKSAPKKTNRRKGD